MSAVVIKGREIRDAILEEIKAEVEGIIGGKPEAPKLSGDPVAVIKWVDGTVLDTVWRIGG